jgi:hypothetical protein
MYNENSAGKIFFFARSPDAPTTQTEMRGVLIKSTAASLSAVSAATQNDFVI